MDAGKEPRSAAVLAGAILGLVFLGLSLVGMERDPFGPLSLAAGAVSLGLCFVPLLHGRAGVVARILGVIGLIGWVVVGFLAFYGLAQLGRSLGGMLGERPTKGDRVMIEESVASSILSSSSDPQRSPDLLSFLSGYLV